MRSLIPLILAVAAVPAWAAPSAPTSVTAAAQSATSVQVTWTAVTGASGYRVFRDGTQVTQITGSATTTYTNTGLTQNTTYVFAVSAFDDTGDSVRTSAPSVTTPSTPGAPAGLRGRPTSTTVTLNWNTVNGATGYVVYRDGEEVDEVTTTTLTDTELDPETTYRYTVASLNAAGESAQSPAVAITTFSTTNIRQAYWTRIFRQHDSNFDSIVDFDEYLAAHAGNRTFTEVYLFHRFHFCDNDLSGDLSADEYVAHFAGRTVRWPTRAQAFFIADTMDPEGAGNGDGLLDLEEFTRTRSRWARPAAVLKAFDKADRAPRTGFVSEREFGIRLGAVEPE